MASFLNNENWNVLKMNLEQARTNMISQQIRTWGVTNPVITELFVDVPREQFVTAEYQDLAFADMTLPIGEDQIILSPKVEARMLDELAVQPHETVLEIGTGSGFMTALLAKQAKQVYSVDINKTLSNKAKQRLKALKIKNVTFYVADAAQGFNQADKVDVIVITGALPGLPDQFKDILRPCGRIMAILGDSPMMEATLVRLHTDGTFTIDSLFDTVAPTLVNAHQPDRFVF